MQGNTRLLRLFCLIKDIIVDLQQPMVVKGALHARRFRTPLIPVLRSDVAAGATSDIHLVLVTVVAMRAFPNEFAVIFR